MTIHITCSCGKRTSAPDNMAGKTGQCPACGKPITLPRVPYDQEFEYSPEQTPEATPGPVQRKCSKCGNDYWPVNKEDRLCRPCAEKPSISESFAVIFGGFLVGGTVMLFALGGPVRHPAVFGPSTLSRFMSVISIEGAIVWGISGWVIRTIYRKIMK